MTHATYDSACIHLEGLHMTSVTEHRLYSTMDSSVLARIIGSKWTYARDIPEPSDLSDADLALLAAYYRTQCAWHHPVTYDGQLGARILPEMIRRLEPPPCTSEYLASVLARRGEADELCAGDELTRGAAPENCGSARQCEPPVPKRVYEPEDDGP